MEEMLSRRTMLAGAASVVAAGTFPQPVKADPSLPGSLTIAIQPGIGYGNLLVMKYQKVLEKRYPGTTFNWPVLTNGDAIRDGIISGTIAVGSGGSGPFLIGWDRGVGYKLIGGLNLMDLWMVSRNPEIKSLKDIKPGMKIGMPSPDAIQAIALRMGCQQILGNAHALDTNIVAIQHPLGVLALRNNQLDAHLTSPPFQFEEVADGGRVVFRSWQATGRMTFNCVYTTEAFTEKYPEFVRYFYAELARATDFINHNPDGYCQILQQDSGGKIQAAQYRNWLKEPGIEYSIVPHGFVKIAGFMKDIGMLNKAATIKDLELPMLRGVGD
ncbi:MAG: ABC transporter substrate-binding protein [Candidatus Eremiobacteraeota bacterium]|nr:ABC transporter substrate-binding protein [Candidatus Eremiobacteraeota bacterium]